MSKKNKAVVTADSANVVSVDSAKLVRPAQTDKVGMRMTFGAGRWGTVVRDDAGAPHQTVIKLDSGELIRENRDAIPTQGSLLGLRSTYYNDAGARTVGTVRRFDIDEPFVTIIESNDGFYWFEQEIENSKSRNHKVMMSVRE